MKCSLKKARHLTGAIRPLDVAAIICMTGAIVFLVYLGAIFARERALRAKCRTNLAAIGKSFELYAKENNGSLPDFSGADSRYVSHAWPWDLDTNFYAELKGVSRETFFCPANPGMNDDRHWNFSKVTGNPVRVTSYGMLFNGVRFVPPNLAVRKFQGANGAAPSQTELAFDSTACLDGDYTRIQGLWTDRSNHMRDRKPLGGNLLFTDGHVAWRPFSQMQVRLQTVGPGGTIEWSY